MAFKCSFMTFNIRHDHGPSSPNTILAPPPPALQDTSGELAWSIRKFKVADTLLFYQPDIVGLQEPVYHQVVDLHILVGDDYDWVGAGRDDGNQAGEYAAIFYKKDLFTVLDWKTLWLSDTPDQVGSKSWGAKHPRIATIARFQASTNDKAEFLVINAHFDHVSEESRQESAKLILQHATSTNTQHPIVLLGDFNSTEDELAYQQLTGTKHVDDNRTWTHLEALNENAAHSFAQTSGQPVRTTENSLHLPTHRVFRRGQFMAQQQEQQEQQQPQVFTDTRYGLVTRLSKDNDNKTTTTTAAAAVLSGPYGHDATFTSFGEPEEKDNVNRRIDYIMYMAPTETTTSRLDIKVLSYGVLDNQFDDGCLISDHRPVLSRLAWTPL